MRQNKPSRPRPASNRKSLIVKKPAASPRRDSESQQFGKPFGIKKSFSNTRPYSESNSNSKPFVVQAKTPSADSRKRTDSGSLKIKPTQTDRRPLATRKPLVAQKPVTTPKPSVAHKPVTTPKPPVAQKPVATAKAPATPKPPRPPKKLDPDKCPNCLKLHALCICPEIRALETDLHVLILQHPQEPDEALSTARLAHLSLKNSTLKIGLSWANLTKALGREVQPAKWTVLHLGSGIKGTPTTSNLQFVSKQGTPVDPPKDLEGIVVLDGTWSQSKALWWRNPWLLKLKRSVLMPQEKSLYRELRKEPRSECLSTLESVAEALDALGEPDDIKVQLNTVFKGLLNKYRDFKKTKKTE